MDQDSDITAGTSSFKSASQERQRLELAAASDPWSQGPHLALMDFLEESGLGEELEAQRASFAAKFLPSVDFWRAWLTDKINAGDMNAVSRILPSCGVFV
jgi:hypothetical protein